RVDMTVSANLLGVSGEVTGRVATGLAGLRIRPWVLKDAGDCRTPSEGAHRVALTSYECKSLSFGGKGAQAGAGQGSSGACALQYQVVGRPEFAAVFVQQFDVVVIQAQEVAGACRAVVIQLVDHRVRVFIGAVH